MSRWNRLAVLGILFVFTAGGVSGQLLFHPGAVSPPKREFRGAWIATVTNLDWPSSRSLSASAQRNELTGLLDSLYAAGINAVVFQVRPECDALYNSPYEPWSYWLTGAQETAPSPLYDPLEFAVAEAHRRGMELHAWFNPYRAFRQNNTYTAAASHVTKAHPEWILRCPDGYKILDPGLPDARDHIAKVIADVVRRYSIDGVHMDDYFYPYPEHNFTTEDSASFRLYSRGYPESLKADWRRENVNLLIRQVYDSVQALKPWVKVGMSPFGIWKSGVPAGIFGMSAYDVIYCDGIAWLQEQSIDYLTPQLYWAFGGGQDYGTLQRWWGDSAAAHGRHLYPGIGTYRHSAAEVVDQLNYNRQNPKVQGSVQFRANNIRYNSNGVTDALKSDVFWYAGVIPVMSWKETVPPLAPENLTTQFNAATNLHELLWQAPAAASDGDTAARYVVYRFTTPTFNAADLEEASSLLMLTGTTTAAPRARLEATGVTFSFAVSALDKNNNESSAAGPVSFEAPMGVLTLASPADGEMNYARGQVLRWNRAAGALAYRVQLSSDPSFVKDSLLLDRTTADSTAAVPALAAQKFYYWRAAAGNQGQVGSFTPTWSFRTGWLFPPQLLAPPVASNITRTPTFVWADNGATTYRLRVTDDVTKNNVIDVTISDTVYASPITLEGYRIYTWRVLANNAYGSSDWSAEGRFRTVTVSALEEATELPKEIDLSQNYPNPFNASTRIVFTLPSGGYAGIRVYDLLGREAAVLVDDVLPAGTYTTLLDASHLPSGTYIYVLTTDGSRLARRMVLVR